MTHILACIDDSAFAVSVCDLTGWAAVRLGASVELLSVIEKKSAVGVTRDLSGAIGLGVKSALLDELTRIDEAAGKLAIERGRIILTAADAHLSRAGVKAISMVHRHGAFVETLVERESGADLVVIGKRGTASSAAADSIGSNVAAAVRAGEKPVLLAPSRSQTPDRVAIAYDASPSSSRGLSMLATSPLFAGLPVQIIMAGPDDSGHVAQLAKARDMLAAAGKAVETFLVDGKPDKVIGAHMEANPGLLVMGAYGHSPLRSFVVGSTTTAMIRSLHVPVLMVR